ncbi:MAG: hypothetical protein FWD91_01430 [Treponema sp.]|nr:hypothetical protein [Treponema sp.]
MKKIVHGAVLIMLISVGSLFAQQQNVSDYTFVNVSIEKIYAHSMGFVVLYRTGILPQQVASAFIPGAWFSEPGGRGQLINLVDGSREWPSMSIFTKDGEFSHVRLRVRRSKGHETWGLVPQYANIGEQFKGIEEIRLKF